MCRQAVEVVCNRYIINSGFAKILFAVATDTHKTVITTPDLSIYACVCVNRNTYMHKRFSIFIEINYFQFEIIINKIAIKSKTIFTSNKDNLCICRPLELKLKEGVEISFAVRF